MHAVNLLYIITKLELGGAQKQLLSLINRLDKDRFRPFLLTAREGLLLPEAVSINGLRLKKSRCLERPINPFKDILALIEIYRFIKKNNIGIVHTHSSKAGILGRLAARLARVKIIIHTVHGWSFNDCQPGLERLFFLRLERLFAGFTDKLIVVSNYDKKKGLTNRIGREGYYALIRYGIDYAEFSIKGRNIKKELGINPNEPVVGMVACFKPQKSPQDFIKLASLVNSALPAVKFILVGEGILRKKIEKLIRKFNLQKQVILTGWRRDIPAILSSIDIFMLTSLWEGLPVTVLEAMSCGRPVVATDTGGIGEVITPGVSGFLVSPGDINNMAQRAVSLLQEGNLRAEVGQNAKESLGPDYSVTHMIKETEGLYVDLINAKL